jgi:hypothetical protein
MNDVHRKNSTSITMSSMSRSWMYIRIAMFCVLFKIALSCHAHQSRTIVRRVSPHSTIHITKHTYPRSCAAKWLINCITKKMTKVFNLC